MWKTKSKVLVQIGYEPFLSFGNCLVITLLLLGVFIALKDNGDGVQV